MMFKQYNKIIVVIFLFFCLPLGSATPENKRDTHRNIHFNKIQPDYVLNAIIEDRDGFIWLGTQPGLIKYTGDEELVLYTIEDSPFWDRWWFLIGLICLFFMGLGFIAFYFQRLRSEIKEHKQAVADLQESEQLHRITLNSISDAVFITDAKGRFTYICPNSERIFGYTFEEVKNLGHITKLLGDALFLPEELASSGELTNVERKVKDISGQVHFLLVNVKQVSIKEGRLLYICRDITDRMNAEIKLRENEEKFRSIFKNSPLAIVHLDTSGIITACNENFCKLLDSSPEKIIGVNAINTLKDEMMLNAISQALSGGRGQYEGEYLSMSKELQTPVRAVYSPLKSEDGEVVGAIGVLEDITEQLSAEQEKKELESQLRQLQKVEALGTLAGGIAHDFNNILFSILGYSELMSEDFPEDSPYYESVNEILIGAKRAKGLVDQILTFSRQTDHRVRPLKPELIIKEVIKLIRSTLPTTIKIEKYIDPRCRMILADPTQIHQVAMNMITNAYHAMEESGGTLTIKLQNMDDIKQADGNFKDGEGAFVLFSVQDTGVGMDGITLEKIFDPYFTTKSKGKGTGLGLSVIHGIVKNCKGQIRVKSIPGLGSTFDVYLPAIRQKTISESIAENHINTRGNETILVIDDELSILRLEEHMLERLGYKVTTQDSSLDALALVNADPDRFDLVITDMTMPEMTGDVLAQKLQEIIPELPVIICTGFSEKISRESAASIGVKGLLYKPIVKSEFAKMVRNVIDKSKKIKD